MRAALYMGTLVASRFNPAIQAFYQRLLESKYGSSHLLTFKTVAELVKG